MGTEERTPLDIDPEKLLAFFEKYNDVQAEELVGPYLYKWTEISGNVTAVHYAKDGLVVFLKGRRSDKRKQYEIQAMFEEQRWIDRAKVLKRNEKIRVRGQLMLVISDFVHLVSCEIVE